MSPKRGICAECGTEKALNADGTVRQHLAAGHGLWRGDCPGYGQPPASKAPDPIAAAEARGYAEAVARLRDGERYSLWVASQPFDQDLADDEPSRQQLADYVESTS